MSDPKRYPFNESIDRIWRLLKGDTISETPGVLTGEVLGWDVILSNIAELFNSSYPGETGGLPAGVVATSAEAIAGTDTRRGITPATLAAAIAAQAGDEYGGIYTSTGTVSIDPSKETWTKITGSFHANMDSSSNITPDWNDDQITVAETGIYFIAFQCSFEGGESVVYDMLPYVDGSQMLTARARRKTTSTGDVDLLTALGLYDITGASVNVDLRLYADDTGTFKMTSGQLYLKKVAAT